MRLIEEAGVSLEGKRAVVVGRSNIVGKPAAALLLARSATVTMAHSRTSDLPALCREADILVAAVGRAKMVRGDWIKPGAAVIDVGMNRDENNKLCGDVDFASAEPVAGVLTPVPGGVGLMTIAMLLDNTLIAATRGGYGKGIGARGKGVTDRKGRERGRRGKGAKGQGQGQGQGERGRWGNEAHHVSERPKCPSAPSVRIVARRFNVCEAKPSRDDLRSLGRTDQRRDRDPDPRRSRLAKPGARCLSAQRGREGRAT